MLKKQTTNTHYLPREKMNTVRKELKRLKHTVGKSMVTMALLVWVCNVSAALFTLRLLDVKGLVISGGRSRPGGQGREKLLCRYFPLIASSTSLSIDTQPIKLTEHLHKITGSLLTCAFRLGLNSFIAKVLRQLCIGSCLCLSLTSLNIIDEPYRVNFLSFSTPTAAHWSEDSSSTEKVEWGGHDEEPKK